MSGTLTITNRASTSRSIWKLVIRQPPRLDILLRQKTRKSTKWIFRLRVSSVLKDAFAWNVDGRRPVVTRDVLYSAYSPVNGGFLPAYSRRRGRLALDDDLEDL
jgi:hypothetical protein